MMRNKLARGFARTLKSLVGKRCWGVVAGEGTGSVFVLDFGRKIPQARPIANPHLTLDQRRYKGELSLMVRCAWRIDAKQSVVCGWNDSSRNDGPMVRGLKSLVNTSVKAVTIEPPAMDLTIRFASRTLRVFCDQTVRESGQENYWITSVLVGRLYAVGPRGRLTMDELSEGPDRPRLRAVQSQKGARGQAEVRSPPKTTTAQD